MFYYISLVFISFFSLLFKLLTAHIKQKLKGPRDKWFTWSQFIYTPCIRMYLYHSLIYILNKIFMSPFLLNKDILC